MANETGCNITYKYCWETNVKYAYFILDMPIALLGIVTNILNLVVLNQRPFNIKVTAYTLLVALAVADLLTCAIVFPITFCRCIQPSEKWHFYLQQFYDVYIYLPLANTFATASMWLTLVVSLERYIFVVHAISVKRIWTRKVTNTAITFCYFGAFAINFPYFFLRTIGNDSPPGYTDWSKTRGASVYTWIRLIFIKLIPIFSVAILNYLLIKAIWKFNKKRKQMVHPQSADADSSMSARQQLQMKITAMVVSIAVVLLLCHALEPFAHMPLFTFLFGYCSLHGPGHTALFTTTNILETFSFASNFFFYCIFNQQFVMVLKSLGCGSKKERASVVSQRTVQ